MIVAVVAAASVFLVVQGLKQPNILEEIQPDKLTADAKQVRADLDEDHNEAIIPPRIPDFSIVERTDETLAAVDPTLYPLTHPWDYVRDSGKTRREDPQLFKPRAVQAQGVITTLAMRSGDGIYAIKDLEPADPVEPVEKVRKPSRRELRRQQMMGDGEDEEEYYEEEEGMFDAPMIDPSMAEEETPVRTLDSTLAKRAASNRNQALSKRKHLNPPSRRWVGLSPGTAVVPHKMIFESFKHSLEDAEGYNYEFPRPAFVPWISIATRRRYDETDSISSKTAIGSAETGFVKSPLTD